MKKYRSRFLEGKDQNMKIKNVNVPKMEQIKQMHRKFLNAHVYPKHKIDLTWPK